jgi:hypothetical protein
MREGHLPFSLPSSEDPPKVSALKYVLHELRSVAATVVTRRVVGRMTNLVVGKWCRWRRDRGQGAHVQPGLPALAYCIVWAEAQV